jgi:hypothetical protein
MTKHERPSSAPNRSPKQDWTQRSMSLGLQGIGLVSAQFRIDPSP